MLKKNKIYRNFNEQMEKWEGFLCLPYKEPNRNIIEYVLTIDYEQLKQHSPIELSEYSVIMAQYSFFLQNQSNKCENFINWAKQSLSYFIGEEKTQLMKWTRVIENRHDRIKFLSKKIEVFSQCITNLSRIKKYESN